jgi:hypothetical protein
MALLVDGLSLNLSRFGVLLKTWFNYRYHPFLFHTHIYRVNTPILNTIRAQSVNIPHTRTVHTPRQNRKGLRLTPELISHVNSLDQDCFLVNFVDTHNYPVYPLQTAGVRVQASR